MLTYVIFVNVLGPLSLLDVLAPSHTHTQALGYGLLLIDGNVVNVNRLKKLNLSRVDKQFRVSAQYM